ncbi:23S rRNA (uracil(1939)-C(5))-methyltransferase RlmD [Roseburia hominis]|uniref:23S rRNA (uracil(1939)-C(5))-methyltransferase RlmD n=1 Tax=Roseburia hominis TaxID=301301 RepID=UPI0022E46CAF|nr:23S rRNA (uracil(1939)-C(5))-methyltransferase RlmD [Roseburia hominis]
MKKGQIIEGMVECVEFPNKGIVRTEDGGRVIVKNAVPGQKVSASINKVRKGKCEGRLLEVLERSAKEQPEAACIHAGECGGCTYQTLPYEEQLAMKASQVKKLIDDVIVPENTDYKFLGIKASPRQQEYRNKMEFSFGDAYKGGPLALGMHKRGSFYDIVDVPECRIVDDDFHTVLTVTLDYFKERNLPYYHKLRHTGYLRHLLVRKAVKTREILVDLVTTTQIAEGGEEALLAGWKDVLCAAAYQGTLTGVLHTRNDSVADTVTNEGTDVLFGQDHFYEELLGLRFQITPFSFFQTNSLGAEVLYETAREFIGDALPSGTDADVAEHGKVVFDLYSGTGTIAQMLAPVAKKVIGVEIIPEAVEAAKENARLNSLTNCEFIAGDVLKVIDEIEEKPDYIVLDPPRDGIHPKALEKIIRYGVPQMVYISCKPTSLVRDLEVLQASGYEVKKVCCVDMFPATVHVETVVKLSLKKDTPKIEVTMEPDEESNYTPEEKAAYSKIKEYVKNKYGVNVHTSYIAQVKRMCGLDMGENYNKSKKENPEVKQCSQEKVEYIKDALKHFRLI